MRKHLPAFILTDLLTTVVPASTDKWRFSCASTRELLQCRVHPECQLVYHKLDKILRVLFSEDISTVNINLKTIFIDTYPSVINSLSEVFSKDETSRRFPLLTSLVICGGSVHADNLIKRIEELVRIIKKTCTSLDNLHLPVTSQPHFVIILVIVPIHFGTFFIFYRPLILPGILFLRSSPCSETPSPNPHAGTAPQLKQGDNVTLFDITKCRLLLPV